jgi:hypothetical protein
MTWGDIGDWRAWGEASSWATLLFCLTPVIVSLAIGLIVGGPDVVFGGRRRSSLIAKEQPLWVQARSSSDEPWVEAAEFAIYDRLNERAQHGSAPRIGLGAMARSTDPDDAL